MLTDLSGVYADFGGPGAVEAAKMAVSDFGGKMGGKPIEVISVDHQNKPDVGASKAREWFDTQGVDLITESLNSAVALAVSKVATEKKKIQMVTGAASSRLTNRWIAVLTRPLRLRHHRSRQGHGRGRREGRRRQLVLPDGRLCFRPFPRERYGGHREGLRRQGVGRGPPPAFRHRLFVLFASGAVARGQGRRARERWQVTSTRSRRPTTSASRRSRSSPAFLPW